MSNTKEKMNRAYIENKLAGIIEPMVVSIYNDKPEDFVCSLPDTYFIVRLII